MENEKSNAKREHTRKEMESLFRGYLKMIYPDWDESKLKYDKWRNL